MVKKGIISIDFDGVIIEKIFRRDWVNQTTRTEKPVILSNFVVIADKVWAQINHLWRKPVRGALEGLKVINKLGYKAVVVTSRKDYQIEVTKKWLEKWKIVPYFGEYYFNNFRISGAESKVKNIRKARPVIHVDDNIGTVLRLSQEFPKLRLLWLSKEKGRVVPNNVIQCEDWAEIVQNVESFG